MKTSALPAITAALLFVQGGCTKPEPAAVAAPEPAAEIAAAPVVTPALAPALTPVAVPVAPPSPELPKDMRVIVRPKGAELIVTLVQPRHLVSLSAGALRAFGHGETSLTVPADAPIVWETSHKDTLETLRGTVELDTSDKARPTGNLRARSLLSPVQKDAAGRHACKAYKGASTGFEVLCRVDSPAASTARLFGANPRDRILSVMTGEETFFRIELDTTREADAAVLGYSDGVSGYVVRAESSALPGEPRPALALLSASRRQPFMFRPIPRPHRFPHKEMIIDLF